MKIEFKIYGATLEEVRDNVAKKIRNIAKSKPSGENLVRLEVVFQDTDCFFCNDEQYLTERRESELEEPDDWGVAMQECEDGIIEKLESMQFNPNYYAKVEALFSDENTWM